MFEIDLFIIGYLLKLFNMRLDILAFVKTITAFRGLKDLLKTSISSRYINEELGMFNLLRFCGKCKKLKFCFSSE